MLIDDCIQVRTGHDKRPVMHSGPVILWRSSWLI
jgi:hypothetical protein